MHSTSFRVSKFFSTMFLHKSFWAKIIFIISESCSRLFKIEFSFDCFKPLRISNGFSKSIWENILIFSLVMSFTQMWFQMRFLSKRFSTKITLISYSFMNSSYMTIHAFFMSKSCSTIFQRSGSICSVDNAFIE